MKGIKRLVLLNFIFMSFILGFISQIDFSKAQIEGESLTCPVNFTIEELSENVNSLDNITSIDIPLPSSSWNLTSLQLNFSEIKLQSEIKPIEDQAHGDYEEIYYSNPSWKTYGLGVQINLTETTRIFGVDIYGYKTLETTDVIQVQIRGYNDVDNKPNGIIYAFTNFNVSEVPGWYLQKFNSSVRLPKGNYYLVLFGMVSGGNHYYWAYNEDDPNDPSLYTSKYINNWLPGSQNAPFLYKLIQKVNRQYNPEQINMTAEINGGEYDILNSTSPYCGILSLNGLNWNVNDTNLQIPINNDLDIKLNYSLDYSIKLRNYLPSIGSVLIEAEKDNSWSLDPEIIRCLWNYSIKFCYPSGWNNFTILRNGENVTSEIIVDPINYCLIILNSSINISDTWQIQASSPRTEFTLETPPREYQPGQEIRFSIETPVDGNYTLVLYNADHYEIEEARTTITYPIDGSTFQYIIPSYSVGGEYHAYVYFFDGINAGVETALFTVTVPFTIDPFLLFIIILASAIGIGTSISIAFAIKGHKRKVKTHKEEIYNKCMDILNLNYIMVSEKKSSLNVYEQVFTKQKIDPTLISGFLSAIHSFGIELTNSEEQTQTIKLEYKNSKVIMAEFRDFRIILIISELPSQKFLESLNALAFDIELYYSRYLESFKGNVEPFKGIETLLKKHLNISFLYPLNIVKNGKTKINQTEKLIIERALNLMKKNIQKYFYTTHIMEKNAYDSKEIEAIFSLIDKKIFQPVI